MVLVSETGARVAYCSLRGFLIQRRGIVLVGGVGSVVVGAGSGLSLINLFAMRGTTPSVLLTLRPSRCWPLRLVITYWDPG